MRAIPTLPLATLLFSLSSILGAAAAEPAATTAAPVPPAPTPLVADPCAAGAAIAALPACPAGAEGCAAHRLWSRTFGTPAPAPARPPGRVTWIEPHRPAPPPAETSRITLSLRHADLIETLRAIIPTPELNLVVQPGVTGEVTAELEDVPWDQAFDQILRANDLAAERDGRILWVAPRDHIEAAARSYATAGRPAVPTHPCPAAGGR